MGEASLLVQSGEEIHKRKARCLYTTVGMASVWPCQLPTLTSKGIESRLKEHGKCGRIRASSTYLTKRKQRTKHKQKTGDGIAPKPRDPLMAYKKPQLVARLREAQQQLQNMEQQLAVLADACLQRDVRVAEVEAKLAELEPYRDFVEQVRQRVRREEYSDDSPSAL